MRPSKIQNRGCGWDLVTTILAQIEYYTEIVCKSFFIILCNEYLDIPS